MQRSRSLRIGLALALSLAGPVLAYNGQVDADHRELTGDPWYSRQATKLGEYFTFYYFNPDGDGIFRFGKLGKVLTERFRWKAGGGELTMVFGNTGEKAKTGFRVDPAPGKEGTVRLVLEKDPREGRKATEYFRKKRDTGDNVFRPGTPEPPAPRPDPLAGGAVR